VGGWNHIFDQALAVADPDDFSFVGGSLWVEVPERIGFGA
jgi:hypothetical protein